MLLKDSILQRDKHLIIKGLLCFSALISVPSFADDSLPSTYDKSEKSELAPTQPVVDKPLLEKINSPRIQHYLSTLSDSQAYVGKYVQSFGESIDRFFGSKDLDVVYKGNRLIVYTPFTIYDDGTSKGSINYRAQIDLPKTNNRWKILVSSFEQDELNQTNSLNNNSSTPRSNTQTDNPNSSENSLAGRFLLGNTKNRISQIDVGLKFINYIEPNPYVKYKIRYIKKSDKTLTNRGTQTLYLEREKGFAWEGQNVLDYQSNKEWLTRSQTTASWWRRDRQVLLNQKGVLFQTVSPYTVRGYYLDTNWSVINQGVTFENVGVGVNVRQQLYKKWLFGEIEPRVTWYESDNFSQPVYSLRVMLEMHFYK
ncbi:hypothetical protein [Thiomicrorhabdus sp.]|uniref:hypothetical protein n=1 Tax=Thiomicrorhabdus sp. TaxID=2039724 RepID=UPI002AA8A8E3|nr:hypothetical protein [Thiomicrorhabdus sp.]